MGWSVSTNAISSPLRARPVPAARFRGPLQLVVFTSLLLLAWGCRERREPLPEGAAPPPAPSVVLGACRGGGGVSTDPVSAPIFERRVGRYCLDPNGETRAYGAEAQRPLDQVCLEQFNGECEIYKGFGLERVVTLRYVDGEGSSGEVSVVLARFASREGAYGFYSRRVVGDEDPRALGTQLLEAGGAGALGTGEAYVWRGHHVAQLTYSNTDEAREALIASSARVLPELARSLGERIPGELSPPSAVALLPSEQRLPHGATYVFDELLGISGIGGGAIGYYAEGEKRYRVLVIAAPDVEAAEDLLETFGKLPGAERDKQLPFPARGFTRRSREGAAKTRWWVAQVGARIVGIGDEEHVLDVPEREAAARSLSAAELHSNLRRLVRQVRQGAAADTSSQAIPPAVAQAAGTASAPAPSSSAP